MKEWDYARNGNGATTHEFTIAGFAASLAGALGSLPAAPAAAQNPDEFYKGRQIALIIAFAPGGGYDAYTRLAGRHIGKHIPSNPTIVPQNTQLTGGLRAANYLYKVAAQDGSVIGSLANNIMEQQILAERALISLQNGSGGLGA